MSKKTYPIERSRGGDNTYILPCDVYGGRRHYAVCLRIIERHEEGNAQMWEPDCNTAIACRECPAVDLRKKEEKAGKALFFVERQSPPYQKVGDEEIFSKSYQNGWAKKPSKQGKKATVKIHQSPPTETPKPKKRKPSGSMHADLVNKLMEEEQNDEQRKGPE